MRPTLPRRRRLQPLLVYLLFSLGMSGLREPATSKLTNARIAAGERTFGSVVGPSAARHTLAEILRTRWAQAKRYFAGRYFRIGPQIPRRNAPSTDSSSTFPIAALFLDQTHKASLPDYIPPHSARLLTQTPSGSALITTILWGIGACPLASASFRALF